MPSGSLPPLIGGVRPDTCTCDEHPYPHWHCRWSGDGGWHCPQQPHVHRLAASEDEGTPWLASP